MLIAGLPVVYAPKMTNASVAKMVVVIFTVGVKIITAAERKA